jgi:CDP-diacylglycerol pyrophosphatase
MKLTYAITIIILIAAVAAIYYKSKQPSPLDKCRTMVIAEVEKNQQFVDAVAPLGFHEVLGGK